MNGIKKQFKKPINIILLLALIIELCFLTSKVYADLTATEGLAIDLSSAGAGLDMTIAFDPTEITGGTTWDDGGDASVVWTWNLTAGDPSITFGNGVVNVSSGTLQQGGSDAVLDSDIGSTVQAYDADLTTYAGITPSANIQTFLGSADYATARTNLGVAIGSDVQAYDADLATLSGPTAWRVFYSNGTSVITELALGTSGQYLKANGATSAPTWDTPGGSGDMLKSVYDVSEDGFVDGNDVAFNATTWDGDVNAPSMNAIRDQFVVIDNDTDGTVDAADVATTVTITDNENTAENNPLVFVAGGDLDGGDLGLESDGDLHYNPSTGTVTAIEFAGGGASLTSIDAATGDSATAFFDAGTIEHEYGGMEADVSGYSGLVAISGGSTAEVDSLDELEAQLADVTRIVSEAVMPEAATDPDVDAAGELSVDTDGANEPNDVVLRTASTSGNQQYALGKAIYSFQATIIAPQDLADSTRDACPIWENSTGMTFYITKIRAWSDTDDTTLNVETYDSDWNNNATVDALEIASDATANYYVEETTITANTIADGSLIVLDFDDTDDPGWVKINIMGWFDADVD